jgi:LmbE family N-acetylglucosaminyl deacetylase
VHDFGFSKNGKDTLARWGRERIIERLVRAYRSERPDIVIPTFLDVPGQHGHHRAMTEAAQAAIALAADPNAFPEHFAEGLTSWQVQKFYLPAWSGGGGTYDDEVPPPEATLTVAAPGRDVATGAGFDEIGEWSRLNHASQGMGRWRAERKTAWPLHLLLGRQGEAHENDITADLPATLADVAATPGLDEKRAVALVAAQKAINATLTAFPERSAIIGNLNEAAARLAEAETGLDDGLRARIGHRIARKRAEIDAALGAAADITVTAFVDPVAVAPGGTAALKVLLADGANAENVTVTPVLPAGVSAGAAAVSDGLLVFPLTIAADAPLTGQYPASFAALGGNDGAAVIVEADIGGRRVTVPHDLEEPLRIAPAAVLELDPPAVIAPLAGKARDWTVKLHTGAPIVGFDTPEGFTATVQGGEVTVRAPATLKAGRHELMPRIGGAAAFRVTPIAYPHIGRTAYREPARLDVLALDLKLPQGARIGYAGGGADNAGTWLNRMGLDVTELDAEALSGDLSGFTTIVVGIFAFGLRPDLFAARDRLRDWVERGGHLVTLYHRPSDGWDPERTPPRRLVIGAPSLRWRVTDPDAEVKVLAPGHKLLAGPNTIAADDWAGWDKERGLYFAADWDKAYTPLLSLHDAGEKPLKGAWLSAEIGKGRHTHVALVLHHQMDRLVPGAFRLMANLVQPA